MILRRCRMVPALLFLLTLLPLAAIAAADKQLIAYFPEWGMHLPNPYFVKDMAYGHCDPSIDSGCASDGDAAARLTVLNYSFAIPAPGPNGDVVCTLDDPVAAYQQPYDAEMAVDGIADTDSDPIRGHFNQLRKLKADHAGLKILVAIGGWTGSTWFSDAAADEASRAAFVASCIDLFIDGNLPAVDGSAAGIFDGFDIDWEYPITGGDGGVHHSSSDDVNLTALLAEFRRQLDVWKLANGGDDLLLTMAVPASDFRGKNYQISRDQDHVDWFNLMSYDFHGSWDKQTGHLTNLLTSADDPSSDAFKLSLDNAVRLYHYVYGVPFDRLVGGATFYGRGWKNVSSTNNGLYQNGQTAPGEDEDGANYSNFLAGLEVEGYNWYWDDQALAAWLYSPTDNIFWSLDDPQSLALKHRFAEAYGLRGMMLWEISGDYLGGTLLAALDTGDPGPRIDPTEGADPLLAPAITKPDDCAISLAGVNQVINATTEDDAVQVEFFLEGAEPESLGFDNRAPWSWAWFNLPPGEHRLTAVASDGAGSYSISAPVRLTVYGEDSGIVPWQTSVTYQAGDEVFYEGCIYAAKRLHVGSRVRTPGSNRYWAEVTCQDCGGGGGGSGAGNPPTVSFTEPAKTSFEIGEDIPLAADASDSDGTVSQVEFFNGNTSLCVFAAPPYECLWQNENVSAGSYTLRAVATDNNGNTAEDTVAITVISATGCTLSEWVSDLLYRKGDQVHHEKQGVDIKWQAKRDNQGVEPGTSPSKWTNLGPCGN
jgi:chitinase